MKQLRTKSVSSQTRVPANGMRDIKVLAADPTTDKVSGYSFRSEEEVRVFLKSLEKDVSERQAQLKKLQRLFASLMKKHEMASNEPIIIKRGAGAGSATPTSVKRSATKEFEGLRIDPISITQMEKLTEKFELVKDLHSKLELLDTLDAQVQHMFRGENTKLEDNVTAMKKQYDKLLKDALKFLQTVAKKHEPTEFYEQIVEVMGEFYDKMKDSFTSADQFVFVTTKKIDLPGVNDKHYLVFNHYVKFTDFRNDQQDYTYPEYYIVFTATVDPKGLMKTYVQVLHSFRTPGTFKFGSQFKDVSSGIAKLSALLAVDEFLDLLEKQSLPIGQDDVKLDRFKSANVIADIRVENDTVTVLFKPTVTKENVRKVAQHVLRDILGLISGKTQAKLKSKLLKPRNNQYGVEFQLVLPTDIDSTKFLTPQKVDALKTDYGFDDNDIKALHSIIQRGHA